MYLLRVLFLYTGLVRSTHRACLLSSQEGIYTIQYSVPRRCFPSSMSTIHRTAVKATRTFKPAEPRKLRGAPVTCLKPSCHPRHPLQRPVSSDVEALQAEPRRNWKDYY